MLQVWQKTLRIESASIQLLQQSWGTTAMSWQSLSSYLLPRVCFSSAWWSHRVYLYFCWNLQLASFNAPLYVSWNWKRYILWKALELHYFADCAHCSAGCVQASRCSWTKYLQLIQGKGDLLISSQGTEGLARNWISACRRRKVKKLSLFLALWGIPRIKSFIQFLSL